MLFIVLGFVAAVVLGMVVIPNILLISYKKRLFDLPDERKVHAVPVPRLGGLSFFPVILMSVCLTVGLRYYFGYPIEALVEPATLCDFLFLTVGCTLLYLTGIADDLIGVGYRYKFIVQILTSALLVLPGHWINSLGGLFGIYSVPAWLGVPFTMLIIVYITNAINLIDGIDGLASGLSCIALASLGIIFLLKTDFIYVLLALATLGVLIPFWFYNVFGNAQRGHKLFMGDTGSLTLGYILSFLVIRLSNVPEDSGQTAGTDIILAFSTLLVPLLDVVRVVIHRLREKKSPFLPDKNHFHHKLQRTGMRIRQILLTILGVSVFFIVFNALLADHLEVTLLLLLDIVLWTVMQLFINVYIRRHEAALEQEQV